LLDLANETIGKFSSENQLVGIRVFAPSVYDSSQLWIPTGIAVREVFYSYDSLGRRMEKKVIDHQAPSDPSKSFWRRFVYEGEEILGEYSVSSSETNTLIARYTHSGLRADDVLAVDAIDLGTDANPIATTTGSFQYIKDGLGTISEIYDSSGRRIQRMIYSAYGVLLGVKITEAAEFSDAPSPVRTAYGFTGREHDSESGMMYYRARYYDPTIGRFLQKDPEPGKLGLPISMVNSYAYVANNPLNLMDPSGRSILGFVGDLIVGIVAGVAAILLAPLAVGLFSGILAGGILGTIEAAVIGAAAGGVAGGVAGGLAGGLYGLTQGLSFSQGFWAGAVQGAVTGAISGGLAGINALKVIRGGAESSNFLTDIASSLKSLQSSCLVGAALIGGAEASASAFITGQPVGEQAAEVGAVSGVISPIATRAVTTWIQSGHPVLGCTSI